MNILEVEADFEPATRYGFEFRVNKYVYPYFQSKGLNVTQLLANKARTKDFKSACNQADIDFITGFGHGDADTFTGQDYEVLWEANSFNSREVAGRIVHLLSCDTAKRLGMDIVSKGGRTYFGYYKMFVFSNSDPPPKDPKNDTIADPFFKCDSQIDRLLADGLFAQDVYILTLQSFDAEYGKMLAIDSEAAGWLLWDKYSLCLYGDPAASLQV